MPTLTPLPNRGLRLSLNDCTKIRSYQGGGEFWETQNQQTILQALGEFLPNATEEESGTVVFSHFVGGKEVCAESLAAGGTGGLAIPPGEIQRLQAAVEKFKQKEHDPLTEGNAKRMIAAFKLPDPRKDPEFYRLYGPRWDRKLLVLWGLEKEAESALLPAAALTRLPRQSSAAGLVKHWPWLLVLLLAILAGVLGWPYAKEMLAKHQGGGVPPAGPGELAKTDPPLALNGQQGKALEHPPLAGRDPANNPPGAKGDLPGNEGPGENKPTRGPQDADGRFVKNDVPTGRLPTDPNENQPALSPGQGFQPRNPRNPGPQGQNNVPSESPAGRDPRRLDEPTMPPGSEEPTRGPSGARTGQKSGTNDNRSSGSRNSLGLVAPGENVPSATPTDLDGKPSKPGNKPQPGSLEKPAAQDGLPPSPPKPGPNYPEAQPSAPKPGKDGTEPKFAKDQIDPPAEPQRGNEKNPTGRKPSGSVPPQGQDPAAQPPAKFATGYNRMPNPEAEPSQQVKNDADKKPGQRSPADDPTTPSAPTSENQPPSVGSDSVLPSKGVGGFPAVPPLPKLGPQATSLEITNSRTGAEPKDGKVEVALSILPRDEHGKYVEMPAVTEWTVDGVVQKENGTALTSKMLPVQMGKGKHRVMVTGRNEAGKVLKAEADVEVNIQESGSVKIQPRK